MARIKVTPDVLRDKANTLRAIAASIEAKSNEMDAEIKNLTQSGVWEEEAVEKFRAQFTNVVSQFADKKQVIESYAAWLESAATFYEEQSSTNSTKLG